MKRVRISVRARDDGTHELIQQKVINGGITTYNDWNTITNLLRSLPISNIFRWDEGRFDESRYE